MNHSGWPITLEELGPYYNRAHALLGIENSPYAQRVLRVRPGESIAIDSSIFDYRCSKWIPFKRRNLWGVLGPKIGRAGNVHVFYNAPVTRLCLDPDGTRLNSILVAKGDGSTMRIRARHFVLCLGTLETARLMLASNDVLPDGVGNTRGHVGRFFHDHVSFRAAEVWPTDLPRFAAKFAPSFRQKVMYFPRVTLSSYAQHLYQCRSAFGHFQFEASDRSAFVAIRDILRRKQSQERWLPNWGEISNVIGDMPYMARLAFSHSFGGLVPYPPGCRLFLQVDAEQEPNEASRVYLSRELDELGMPIIAIDWRISDRDYATAQRFVEVFSLEWKRLSLGTIQWCDELDHGIDAWRAVIKDTFHQAGTTRMAQSASLGVVDKNLRIFGIQNAFVASCAVFPTGGSANPTLTMQALTIRLADFLKSDQRSSEP